MSKETTPTTYRTSGWSIVPCLSVPCIIYIIADNTWLHGSHFNSTIGQIWAYNTFSGMLYPQQIPSHAILTAKGLTHHLTYCFNFYLQLIGNRYVLFRPNQRLLLNNIIINLNFHLLNFLSRRQV